MTEPLLRTLSTKGERLTVIAVPWVAPVYHAMQHINGLEATIDAPFQHGGLQWHARRTLASRIKLGEWGKFDRAYVLPNSLKSALLPWLAGIPERIGYKGELRYGVLNRRLCNPPRHERGSMVEFYLRLAGDSEVKRWGLTPKLQTTSGNANTLTRYGLAQGQYTVIVPGAEYGSAKRWPESHFAELIVKLNKPVVLLGSPKEQLLCEAIRGKALQASQQSLVSLQILNLAAKTSLLEAIHIIADAKYMISNDSGLMHVAAAFGIPQIAIFGSSDPRHTPPLNNKAKVLWLKEMEGTFKGLDCSPCFERECPLQGGGHLRCLNAITSDQVASVATD
jgi:heptosyltransferase II